MLVHTVCAMLFYVLCRFVAVQPVLMAMDYFLFGFSVIFNTDASLKQQRWREPDRLEALSYEVCSNQLLHNFISKSGISMACAEADSQLHVPVCTRKMPLLCIWMKLKISAGMAWKPGRGFTLSQQWWVIKTPDGFIGKPQNPQRWTSSHSSRAAVTRISPLLMRFARTPWMSQKRETLMRYWGWKQQTDCWDSKSSKTYLTRMDTSVLRVLQKAGRRIEAFSKPCSTSQKGFRHFSSFWNLKSKEQSSAFRLYQSYRDNDTLPIHDNDGVC